jgi:hypothetical protein
VEATHDETKQVLIRACRSAGSEYVTVRTADLLAALGAAPNEPGEGHQTSATRNEADRRA